ncbi:helix-turn-helix domain-containing protein [Embleya sp. NPDC020630]|uniref:helix-turn-helix domain-containing protein n=1 Tax=Embleya sp. NPDC020630 TaxID=3363979 RepID=UPI0037B7E8CD
MTQIDRADHFLVNALLDDGPAFFGVGRDDTIERVSIRDSMGLRGTRSRLVEFAKRCCARAPVPHRRPDRAERHRARPAVVVDRRRRGRARRVHRPCPQARRAERFVMWVAGTPNAVSSAARSAPGESVCHCPHSRVEAGVDVGAERREQADGRVEQADGDVAFGAGRLGVVVLRAAGLARGVLAAASRDDQERRGRDRGHSDAGRGLESGPRGPITPRTGSSRPGRERMAQSLCVLCKRFIVGVCGCYHREFPHRQARRSSVAGVRQQRQRAGSGMRVRQARVARAWTLAELGRRAGYSAAQVSRYERGLAPLTHVTVIRRFTPALELPVEDFGLAPTPPIPGARPAAHGPFPGLPGPTVVREEPREGENVRRRRLLANLAATASLPLVGAGGARTPASGDGLVARVRDAMLGLDDAPPTTTTARVRGALAVAMGDYHAGRYGALAERLPRLVAAGHALAAAHGAQPSGPPVPFGVHAPAVVAVLVQEDRLQVWTDDERRPRGTVVVLVHRQREEPAGPRQVRTDHDRAELVPARGTAAPVVERRAQERTAVVDDELRHLFPQRRTTRLAIPLVQVERHLSAGLVRQPSHDVFRDQQLRHRHRILPSAAGPADPGPLRQIMDPDAALHTAVHPNCPIRHPAMAEETPSAARDAGPARARHLQCEAVYPAPLRQGPVGLGARFVYRLVS